MIFTLQFLAQKFLSHLEFKLKYAKMRIYGFFHHRYLTFYFYSEQMKDLESDLTSMKNELNNQRDNEHNNLLMKSLAEKNQQLRNKTTEKKNKVSKQAYTLGMAIRIRNPPKFCQRF